LQLEKIDYLSLGIVIFIFALSFARFEYLPQYTDAYYHLSCAHGLILSGGWVGWEFWNNAPYGRPYLYPPFYHLILVFLQKLGIDDLNSVKISEVFIPGAFFLTLWWCMKKLKNTLFAFITVLSLSSFFSFYASLSANVSANLAIIFGLLSWYFMIKRGKWLSSLIFLIFSFYTHPVIPWLFFTSYLFLLFTKKYRFSVLKVLTLTIFIFLPFLIHELSYLSFLNINYLKFNFFREVKYFLKFSIFILLLSLLGIVNIFIRGKNNEIFLIFLGYTISSIILFCAYPYRLFSAQGALGFCFFSSLFIETILQKLMPFQKRAVISFICVYLLICHSTIRFKDKKPVLNFLDSTFYHFFKKDMYSLLELRSIFYPSLYLPIIKVIRKNTKFCDIISSNINIMGELFASLSNRPTSNFMLPEVSNFSYPYLGLSKIIIWIKPEDYRLHFFKDRYKWRLIYENKIAWVFESPNLKFCIVSFEKSKFHFSYIFLVFCIFLFILVRDNISKKRKTIKFLKK